MFQPTIKINTSWKNEISWTVVMIFLINMFIKNEQQVMAYMALIVTLFMLYKKIVLPEIPGFTLYFISIIIMFFYGIFVNDIAEFVKGTFYVINNIVIVVVAYYACRYEKGKSMIKTIYLSCMVLLVSDWIKLVLKIGEISTLGSLRDVFSKNIMDILMFSVLLFYECILNKQSIYGKNKDRVCMIVAFVTVLISLGRTQILCLIIGILVAYIISIIKENKKQRLFVNLIVSFAIGAILVFLTFLILPDDVTTPFVEKVENSFTEISSDNKFEDEASISSNWRGYENKNAMEQWKNVGTWEELFGQGMGAKIKLKSLPELHKKVYGLTDDSTPLLHNGFYTLLIKGGLFALVSLFIWLLYPLRVFRKQVQHRYEVEVYGEMLIMNIMMIVTMYVIRGLVGSGTFAVWAIVIGWNSCRLRQSFSYSNERLFRR